MEIEERIKSKIQLGESCWKWIAATQGAGYGTVWNKKTKKVVLAHRYVYELIKGEIPKGLTLDHLCRNRACVNPDHLEPVSMKENILRGVSPSAKKARQVLCIRGHELSVAPSGARRCYVCVKAYNQDAINKEKSHQRDKEWREKNREYDRARKAKWRASHAH